MALSAEGTPEFTKWRSILWPIHGYELKKVLPMLGMFFFISLIYSLLRNTKDTLIVTAPGGGADLIPFLKVYGVIPASLFYVYLYSRLSARVSKKKLFLYSMAPFLLFYSAFIWLYPIRDSIQPVAAAVRVEAWLPQGLANFVAMGRHWVLSLFYVLAELWGSVALSLLFWGFANDITRVEEAKRFYALFGIGANLALIAVKFVDGFIHFLQGLVGGPLLAAGWSGYLTVLMTLILLSIGIIIAIYLWMQRFVITDPRLAPEPATDSRSATQSATRPRASLGASLAYLWRSKSLRYIAVLVIAYGIAINLLEVTWKSYLGLQYPNPSDYQSYMVNFTMATGMVTVVLMLFVASNVIRIFGWTPAALATPVVLLVTGIGFFGFILTQEAGAGWAALDGMTPLALGVLFGTVQNVMSKATKYSLFDPTKEMAYIPLDPEAKVKGKAAIDVIGARFGKAGGSLIQQVLIGLYGSLRAVTGHIAVLLFAIIGAWIWAALRLGREFTRMTKRP